MTDRAPSTVTVQRDVPFHEVGGETLTLDLYDAATTSGPKPVAVLVRGGGFTDGDKGEFARHALDLAADGYLAVEPQYRLAPAWTFPAPLVDVKAAVEWVRAEGTHHGADPERVVGIGHSAGANLVALAAATADEPGFEPEPYPGASSSLSAVVGYAGAYDLRALDDALAKRERFHRPYLDGTPEEIPEAYDLASPAAQVGVDAPPTLLLHGTDDRTVPPSQSTLFAETLEPLTDVVHETVPAGHAFPFEGEHYDDVYERTVEFFEGCGVAAGRGSGQSDGPVGRSIGHDPLGSDLPDGRGF